MAWLRHRQRRPELMDQPGLDPSEHRRALRALQRINWLSASATSLFGPLRKLPPISATTPLRILDVASGGGDVPLRIWQKAKRLGLNWRIVGCDLSPVAVEYAREQAQRIQAEVDFFPLDVLRQPIEGEFDAIICSLFLHHLADHEVITLLQAMRRVNPRLIAINDLNRSWLGWWAARLASRLLTTSSVVHTDGPISVEGAFTPDEAMELARQAGLNGVSVRRCWPFRWLLTWRGT